MTSIELHPEHLLERARHETLGPRDAAILRDHLAQCSACALQIRLVQDYASIPLESDDAAGVSRLVRHTLAQAERADEPGEAPTSVSERPARIGRTVSRWLLAAAVLLIASGGVAAGYFLGVQQSREPAAAPVRDTAPPAAPSSSSATPRPEPEASTIDEPMADEEAEGSPTDAEPRRSARGHRGPGPDTLLAEATAARREGQHRRASRLYRALQRRFPASREATVSRIACGRLLLDHLHDLSGALAQFEGYLQRAPDGPLALEARIGRAVALQRLGRNGQERRAWQDVLRHHPDSLHADRARQRLDALSGP